MNMDQFLTLEPRSRNPAERINYLVYEVHQANVKAGWWTDIQTGESLVGKRNVGELLALVHSEISEALEAHRKDLMDDKLPHRKGIEVELADAVIRIFDLAGGLGLDLGGAYVEKLAFNRTRADHKIENRLKDGGKKI
jgi:NTP pyrophosphatase (non-canonical NTP hydrolase)